MFSRAKIAGACNEKASPFPFLTLAESAGMIELIVFLNNFPKERKISLGMLYAANKSGGKREKWML